MARLFRPTNSRTSIQQLPLQNDFSRRRVIPLVEAEPFRRMAICNILGPAGSNVLPAEDTREAMKVDAEGEPRIHLGTTDMVLREGRGATWAGSAAVVLITSGYFNRE
jgi:hypothetical protein